MMSFILILARVRGSYLENYEALRENIIQIVKERAPTQESENFRTKSDAPDMNTEFFNRNVLHKIFQQLK